MQILDTYFSRSENLLSQTPPGSSFNSQPLEIFVASAKVKRRLLLRPLTNFFRAERARSALWLIRLQRPTPQKLHALHKKQERLFLTAAPVFFGAERAVSALLAIIKLKLHIFLVISESFSEYRGPANIFSILFNGYTEC